MNVMINGELAQITEPGCSIARLLQLHKVESPDMVSVRLNDEIIDRGLYENTRIAEQDEIEFLYFMGGGGC
jgi:sulfur carrier protein